MGSPGPDSREKQQACIFSKSVHTVPAVPPTLILNGCLTYSGRGTKLANEEQKNYKVSRHGEGQIVLQISAAKCEIIGVPVEIQGYSK